MTRFAIHDIVHHSIMFNWGEGRILGPTRMTLLGARGYRELFAWKVKFSLREHPVKCLPSELRRRPRKQSRC